MLSFLWNVIQHLYGPIYFMFLVSLFLPGTIFNLIQQGQFSILPSPSKFKYAWFARFWAVYGPGIREGIQLLLFLDINIPKKWVTFSRCLTDVQSGLTTIAGPMI